MLRTHSVQWPRHPTPAHPPKQALSCRIAKRSALSDASFVPGRLSYTNYQSLQRRPVTSFGLSPRPVRGMDRETAVTLDAGSGYLPRLAHISSGHRFHICKSSIPHLFGPSRLRMLESPLGWFVGAQSSSATRWFRRTSVLPKGGSESSSPRRRSSRLRGSEPPRRGSCRPAEVGVPNFIQAQRGRNSPRVNATSTLFHFASSLAFTGKNAPPNPEHRPTLPTTRAARTKLRPRPTPPTTSSFLLNYLNQYSPSEAGPYRKRAVARRIPGEGTPHHTPGSETLHRAVPSSQDVRSCRRGRQECRAGRLRLAGSPA